MHAPYAIAPPHVLMISRLAPLALLLLAACSSYPDAPPPGPAPDSPTTSATPLSDRTVAYTMDVTLDPDARTVSGTMRVRWTNTDAVPVDTLMWHLYLNAFREQSTWMAESGGSHRGSTVEGEDKWGSVTVDRVARDGVDLTDRLTISPTETAIATDSTVAALALNTAVAPGDSVVLDVAFTSKLPRIFARTGYAETAGGEPFFMVAQWFPKLAVYETPGTRYVPDDAPRGRWSAHAFHNHSEFYADFGTYRVRMTLPTDYVVGATGLMTDEQSGDDTKTLTFAADDVHDFAWTASPAYRVFESQWKHVRLRLLTQPEHAGQADRYLEAARVGLEGYSDLAGEYPWTTLTLVDGVGDSNGMEYPTLVTLGTGYGAPPWVRLPEVVTVHEIGHQWFQGMLASNEAEEAWLDEGINSYTEVRIIDAAWNGADGDGSVIDLPGLGASDFEVQQLSAAGLDLGDGAIAAPTWEQENAYSARVYSKPAMLMASMETLVGRDAMRQVMRDYAATWRFRHPTSRDFIASAETSTGQDLGWFFDAYLYGDAVLSDSLSLDTDSTGSVRLQVHRLGTAPFPRQVEVIYPTRTQILDVDRNEGLDVRLTEAPTSARLLAVPLDQNAADDAVSLRPDAAFARKLHLKAAQAVHLLLSALTSL